MRRRRRWIAARAGASTTTWRACRVSRRRGSFGRQGDKEARYRWQTKKSSWNRYFPPIPTPSPTSGEGSRTPLSPRGRGVGGEGERVCQRYRDKETRDKVKGVVRGSRIED